MNPDDRMILLFMQGQQTESRIMQIMERIDLIQSSHQEIHRLLHRGWKPSKEQEVSTTILRHNGNAYSNVDFAPEIVKGSPPALSHPT